MNEISAVLIDDEQGNIVTLQTLLKDYCPEIAVAGVAYNSLEGYDLIKKVNPTLVFLDIEMPYGNAFSLLDKLLPIEFEVIFITAFNEYAIKGFKYAALDYLLKPVNINELKNAVTKAVKRLKEKRVNTRIDSLLTNLRTENLSSLKIGLPTAEGFCFENVTNISAIEAQGNYSIVYLKGGIREIVAKHLKDFEELLPSTLFCRVHHSYIININFVKKYYRGRGGYVEMENGMSIEISVRKKDDFLNMFIH